MPTHPRLGAGGVLGIFATRIVAQDCVFFPIFDCLISPRPPSLGLWRHFDFRFSVDTFPPRLPLRGDIAVVSLEVVLCPFRMGFLSFSLYLGFLVGFVASPFRVVGMGFEEPHLRLLF